MSEIPVKMTVVHRGRWGQFASHYQNAGTKTVKEAIDQGASISRSLAPVGHKPDPRTIPLRDSIQTEMLSGNRGHWIARARHARAIEFGARPHPITAAVKFFWEAQGRWWIPGSGFIRHPGNSAQPYMRPAYEIVRQRLSDIAKRNYRT